VGRSGLFLTDEDEGLMGDVEKSVDGLSAADEEGAGGQIGVAHSSRRWSYEGVCIIIAEAGK